MQPEQETSLAVESAEAIERPWQFSIRGLLVLMAVASFPLTLTSRLGLLGVIASLAVLIPGLLIYGILTRRILFVLSGLYLYFFLLFIAPKICIYLAVLGVLLFLLSKVFEFSLWLGRRLGILAE